MPRIYTVTPNPNIDRTLTVPAVLLDEVLRASDVRLDPGGKGFNVARALHCIGIEATALAFMGGTTGAQLAEMVRAAGVQLVVVPVQQETRHCIVVTDATGSHHLKVNEPGPEVSGAEVDALLAAVEAEAQPDDLWVLAGSLPRGAPVDLYARLIALLRAKGAAAALDSSGDPLRLALAERPFLIKPNAHEAGHVLGEAVRTPADAARAAARFNEQGVTVAAVSLGAEGLVVAREGQAVHAQPPAVQALNSVGAGDAAVAGMLRALALDLPLDQVARYGAACGAGAAQRPGTDFASLAEMLALAEAVTVAAL